MLRCLGDYLLHSVTKEVIIVLKFNSYRRLKDREKLYLCSTFVRVDNACRDVVCQARNISRSSKLVVSRFRLIEDNTELVPAVEVVKVLNFDEVR